MQAHEKFLSELSAPVRNYDLKLQRKKATKASASVTTRCGRPHAEASDKGLYSPTPALSEDDEVSFEDAPEDYLHQLEAKFDALFASSSGDES